MKRMISILLMAAMLISLSAVGACADVITEEGATFSRVSDVGGIEGSSFYLYVPSNMETPYPMMTPVIYVYGDQPYADTDSAWAALTAAGLDTIAEAEKAAVVMVNPVGDAWDKADIDVYEAIMAYIFYVDGEVKLTYHSLQYAIGEGSGATFINNYLSQNCKRLAAVMTFGGEIGSPIPKLPLPAYIVSGSEEAVEFYLRANDGTYVEKNETGGVTQIVLPTSGRVDDTIAYYQSFWAEEVAEDKTTNIFTYDDAKRVIVSNADATTLDAELIADCWESLFRYTARICLTANFWSFNASIYNETTFTLVRRPNYKEAGMEVVRVDGIGNGIWEDDETKYWYEFVPAAVQEAMENGTGETFPLMMCFHGGGDHPIYEAESVGWAQMCIDHNVIMVSPNGSGAEEFGKLMDYMIEKYPVDISRIYAGGFSGGANSTLQLSNAYPERLAAVAPQSRWSGPYYTELQEKQESYGYDIDLPILIAGQGMETESTNNDYQYVYYDCLQIIMDINEISEPELEGGELNYVKYPYWGFPIEDEVRYGAPYPFALWQGFVSDEDGVPLLALMHSEQTTHVHYPKYAEHIWSWFQQFSRDPQTHEVVYTPAQ